MGRKIPSGDRTEQETNLYRGAISTHDVRIGDVNLYYCCWLFFITKLLVSMMLKEFIYISLGGKCVQITKLQVKIEETGYNSTHDV